MTRGSARAAGLVLAVAALLILAGPAPAAEVKIGGYTKLDLIWSNKIAGTGNGFADEIAGGPSAVPLDSEVAKDHSDFNLDARQSRLNFTGTGEVSGVKLRGFVESDFFTSEGNRNVSNSRGLRLRHAFGQATLPNGFFILGGQTWSTFMNTDASATDTIDFNGPAGQLFNREPQLRVGFSAPNVAGGTLKLLASVESHSVAGPAASTFNQSQELPLFVGKAVWSSSLLTAEVAGAGTKNRAIFGADDDTDTAWGLQGSVAVPVGPLTISGHVHVVDGLNRLANGDFADAAVTGTTPGSTIQNIRTIGWYAGAGFQLTKETTINAIYGWAEQKDPVPFGATGQDDKQWTLHANIIQKLWGNMQAGIEYQHAEREQFGGANGELNRVQAAWWYFF